MKKLVSLLLCVLTFIVSSSFVACDNSGAKGLSFYAPDGAPALAIAKFINDNEDFGTEQEINYNVVSSGDIGNVMSQRKGDFIVMPVNLASQLYNASKKSPYVMTAVITHGNLYLMSSNGVSSLNDLKGQVVGVIGQGLVPDLTLKAILFDNGLLGDVVLGDTPTANKITIKYFTTAPDMIPMLKQGVLSVGLLPEPAASNLINVANNKTWTRLDVQQLYNSQTCEYPQAVLMVKKSVYEKYKTNIDQMKDLFDINVDWINNNVESAVNAVNSKLKKGITPSLDSTKITATVVENCKIYYESAIQAKQSVKNYINKIIALSQNNIC